MNHKRKRCRRAVRCTMCTQHAWCGNAAQRRPFRDQSALHLLANIDRQRRQSPGLRETED